VVGRVANVKMTFFIVAEGGCQTIWGGWPATPEDEAEAASSFWLHGKEV
jgi:hypothetical protein